ncbi:Uncharacterized protein OBRU01_12047 [Operophtera brumata]|uniref:HTH psq-type domain-containing protein n=1 Tax=Operophtera brumata TaxID=104452 RepID=A0A0L7KY78_OPEBR|nr:Uncharacterized protein OBRU01_12047 [Operophtera brumata]
MVNKYKRKTLQAAWDETAMKKALKEVNEMHNSVKSTAKKYGIPRSTLQRHLKSGSAKKKLGRHTTVFTPEQEMELIEYVFHMDALFYGLSKTEFLELVYQYAEMNGILHPFKNDTAGSDWYKGFVVRHPDLTLRKPEPTSIARARGFNRPQVYRFFDLLEAEIEKHDIDATRLYNMDETGIQTSSNKPPRVLTKVGKRQVGSIASTERGRTKTVVCCCNAAGNGYIFDEADFLPATITENPITAAESNDHQPGSPLQSDVDVDRTPSPSIIEQMIHTQNMNLLDNPPDDMNSTNVHASVITEMISSAPATPTIETRPETPPLLMWDRRHCPSESVGPVIPSRWPECSEFSISVVWLTAAPNIVAPNSPQRETRTKLCCYESRGWDWILRQSLEMFGKLVDRQNGHDTSKAAT